MKKKIIAFLLAVSVIATPAAGQALAPQVIAEAAVSGHTVTIGGLKFKIADSYTYSDAYEDYDMYTYTKDNSAIILRSIPVNGTSLKDMTDALYDQTDSSVQSNNRELVSESDITSETRDGLTAYTRAYHLHDNTYDTDIYASVSFLQNGNGDLIYLYVGSADRSEVSSILQNDISVDYASPSDSISDDNNSSNSSDKQKKKIKYGTQKQLYNFCKKHKGYIKLVSPYDASDNKGAKFYKIKVKKVSKYINGVYSITATDGHHYKYSLMIGGEKNAKVPKKGQTLKVVLTNVHVKDMFEENDWGIADIDRKSVV